MFKLEKVITVRISKDIEEKMNKKIEKEKKKRKYTRSTYITELIETDLTNK